MADTNFDDVNLNDGGAPQLDLDLGLDNKDAKTSGIGGGWGGGSSDGGGGWGDGGFSGGGGGGFSGGGASGDW